jgi:predicted Zn finger-like uncharacterized protein
MIAACPKCSARYRIESDRLRPEGVRLRCSHCEAVFRVRPPTQKPQAAEISAPPAEQSPIDSGEASREPLILVADPEIEQGKSTASALVDWGLQPTLVHDGVEAMLTIQRLLPRAIVIDAALPKMFGFQICEIVKRNESLCHIKVVLVGAIHNGARYRRPPSEIYGADAYLERPDMPGGLRSILQDIGILPDSTTAPGPSFSQPEAQKAPASQPEPLAPSPPVVAAIPEPIKIPKTPPSPGAAELAPPPAPVESTLPPVAAEFTPPPAPVESTPAPERVEPPAPVAVDDSPSEEVARAERLARIIVSDIILYNQEKYEAALQTGDIVSAMEAELAEGRSLFVSRIDPSLREQRDFLAEELLRVAGLRSET